MNLPGRFINHSCNSNVGIKNNDQGAYDFIALRKVEKDEELTWDYCVNWSQKFVSFFSKFKNSKKNSNNFSKPIGR